MAIERTPEDHARFSADMARIAASQARKGATPTPGPWTMAPVIGEAGLFNIYAPNTKHAGQAWRIAADMTEGNAQAATALPDLLRFAKEIEAASLESAHFNNADLRRFMTDAGVKAQALLRQAGGA